MRLRESSLLATLFYFYLQQKSEHFDFYILKKLQMFWFVEETFAFPLIKYMLFNLETVPNLFYTKR